MEAAPILPLCDKDFSMMSRKEIKIVTESEIRLLDVFACGAHTCGRCYSENMGYFDFIDDKTEISDRQILCANDACPMFLELVGIEDDQVWRCPWCGGIAKF